MLFRSLSTVIEEGEVVLVAVAHRLLFICMLGVGLGPGRKGVRFRSVELLRWPVKCCLNQRFLKFTLH